MTRVNNTDALKKYALSLRKAKGKSVVVGLPKGEAASRVYKSGKTVLEVGVVHEYGKGKIPMRSFLRTPFIVHEKRLRAFIQKQFKLISEGKPSDDALALIGVFGENIVKEAFTTAGYGNWEPLSQRTIDEKGSSQILIDKGILRSSILSEVR